MVPVSPERLAYLRSLWDELVETQAPLQIDASEGAFQKLIDAYGEPHRRYHTTEHLQELFRLFDEHRQQIADPATVLAAIFYHDVIYRIPADPSASNEQMSAEYSGADLSNLGFEKTFVDRVHALIQATQTHALESEGDEDAALFLDMDMSVLGRDPAGYQTYIDQIREEYSIIPDTLFYPGRLSRFLIPTLESPRIFWSDIFQSRYENRARENLARERSFIEQKLS